MTKFNPLNERSSHKSPKVESLHKLSSSSIESIGSHTAARVDLNREVFKTLMFSEIQYRMDMVSHEIRLMRNTLENYRHHMAQINEDIADIYLSMYQIYIRFENDDRRRYKSSKKERVRLTEKVEEASEVPVKASDMHVETSEIPAELQPQWEDPSKPSTSVNPRHQGRQSESVEVLIKHLPCETQMESHAKRQFLKNMLLHKKSEVTIHLNRHNVYFPELLRVLNDIKELEETTTSILSSETELQ